MLSEFVGNNGDVGGVGHCEEQFESRALDGLVRIVQTIQNLINALISNGY